MGSIDLHGQNADAFLSEEPEVLVDGPAGTGKSTACLLKGFWLGNTHPGFRGAIVRKTRASLTQSAMVTIKKVIPRAQQWPFHHQDQEYRGPRGSIIAVAGLDNLTKLMSTDFDWIYPQECRELSEDDWELLTTRLRFGVMPYTQIIGDTNPDAPAHWLMQRVSRGQLRRYRSAHADNPAVDEAYLARLAALTGTRRARFYEGKWVASENAIYDMWDPARHMVDRFEPPHAWPRYVVVDFGYATAACMQWWAVDGSGRLYRYREVYGSHIPTMELGHALFDLSDGESIHRVLTDHDTAERLELEAHMTHRRDECRELLDRRFRYERRLALTTPVLKTDEAYGIRLVQNRLRAAPPRLYLMRDALVERDEYLALQKLPTCTEEEIPFYERKVAKSLRYGTVTLEEPVDEWNHGCDNLRYITRHLDDPKRRAVAEAPETLQVVRGGYSRGGGEEDMDAWRRPG